MELVRKHITVARGASALVLSGELTEGVSDLSQAMTASGGVPALPEVNQDRSHPDSPEIQEQPHASFRRLVTSGGSQPAAGSWRNVSPQARGTTRPPGPATVAAEARRQAATAQAQAKQSKGDSNAQSS